MQTCFVTHESDTLGKRAIAALGRAGYQTRCIEASGYALPHEVGFFTAAQTAVFDRRKPRFLHVAPHKFSERNIEPPTWAQSTVFLVALRPNPSSKSVRDFKEAVLQVAATYTMWNPWAEPVAPWNPSWPQGTAEAFVVWHDRAKDVVSKPSLEKRIASHLCPIFPPTTVHEHSTLVVIGCAAFNRPHTDVVGTLVAEKMQFVVEFVDS